jgi:hypothetical protein
MGTCAAIPLERQSSSTCLRQGCSGPTAPFCFFPFDLGGDISLSLWSMVPYGYLSYGALVCVFTRPLRPQHRVSDLSLRGSIAARGHCNKSSVGHVVNGAQVLTFTDSYYQHSVLFYLKSIFRVKRFLNPLLDASWSVFGAKSRSKYPWLGIVLY